MKRLKQGFIVKALLVLSVLTADYHMASAQKATASTSREAQGFLIMIKTSDRGIELTCEKGCNWPGKSIRLSLHEQREITQEGERNPGPSTMSLGDGPAPFTFSIKQEKQKLVLVGTEGVAWKTLNLICDVGSTCQFAIDAAGQLEVKVKK